MRIITAQVQMLQSTLKKIEDLGVHLHNSNKSEVVKIAIDIASIVAKAISENKTITFEDPEGRKTTLNIPGVKN